MDNEELDFEELKENAEKGDVEAMYSLAECYHLRHDYKNALHWYKTVFDIDDAPQNHRCGSACNIAHILLRRDLDNQDISQGLKWDKQASLLGNELASHELGYIYEHGIPNDSLPVKQITRYGPYTLKPDKKEASSWYLKSAEQGFNYAYNICAKWYYEGKGFIRNYQKSFYWNRKAACTGLQLNMIDLSRYYEEGIGTEVNFKEAYIWALLAEEHFDTIKLLALEKMLTSQEVHEAQDEAEHRRNIQYNSSSIDDLYNYVISKENNNYGLKSEQLIELEQVENSKIDKLKTWKVDDIHKFKIDMNPRENSILLRYGKFRERFKYGEIFDANGLRLMGEYYKHETDPREPAIQYDKKYSTITNNLSSKRNNQEVVSDFNHLMRTYFSLAKEVKPFSWFGAKGDMDKALKCNFELKVHY